MNRLTTLILILAVSLLAPPAHSHGDEDHGAGNTTTSATAVSGNQLRIVSYPGSLEILVKYPPPNLAAPVTGRVYFADYATNHPVNPAGIELSFPGALGAKVTKQPTKVSDGVYEFVAVFVRDTSHTGLLKYTYGDAEQLATLSPFYAGASATRVIAATGSSVVEDEGSVFSTWLLVPVAIVLILLGYALFRRRRNRLNIVTSKLAASTSATTAATSGTSVTHTTSTT